MKRSEIYREAARRIHVGLGYGGCCDTIADVAYQDPFRFDCAHSKAFAALFKPTDVSSAYWGRQWGNVARDCRVLALCFMAAIAEHEERTGA